MANRHELWELQSMQAAPLSVKIALTESRIREWINHYGIDGVAISFSGGKDSTVLMDIIRNRMGYKDIPAVFVDVPTQYPELKQFALTWDNVEVIRPKISFMEVCEKYGFPLISKEVSECVYGARKYLTKVLEQMHNSETDRQTDRQIPYAYWYDRVTGQGKYQKKENIPSGQIQFSEIYNQAKKQGTKLNARSQIINGDFIHKEKGVITNEISNRYNQEKYKFFLDAPFEVSSECCKVMKKAPLHDYTKRTGRHNITAQMASESRLRTQKWLQNGCNGFDMKNPISNPMSFWLEQDVLLYIKENNLPICSVYGDIVEDWDRFDGVEGQMTISDIQGCEDMGVFDAERPLLKTTGCSRTGCVGCCYGVHLEKGENRFDMLSKSHPQLFDFFMRGGGFDENGLWKPKNGGMGYWFILKWLNIHGGFNIHIPNCELYEEKYGNDETRKYLYS